MTTNECIRCERPARDAAYCCDQCADSLAKALGDVPWLDEQLDITISRQQGIDYRRGSGGKGAKKPAERPLPYSTGASDARTALRGLLVSWVRFCSEEGVRHRERDDALPADTLIAMSRWMLWRVDGLMLHDIAADAIDELTSAVAHCHRLVDRPADRWFAGPCNECDTDLYAKAGSRSVTCKGCGLVYDVAERREWLWNAAQDHLATASEIARAVVVWGNPTAGEAKLVDRIRKWAERALLVPHGHVTVRGKERALYRVGDVMQRLEVEAREKAGRMVS